jgi:hypothetical protein
MSKMDKAGKKNILADTKIINDKTYQDFNKLAPNPSDPNQNEKIEIEQEPAVGTDGDVEAAPHVGARDKKLTTETTIKTKK